jgi:hypothetical protein
MKAKLPKALLAAALCCYCSAQAATVVEDLTEIAATFDMRYVGVIDYAGKAYYRFVATKDMAKAPQEVLIPADVESRREEQLCFQSGFASGWMTGVDMLSRPRAKTGVTH